MIHIILPFLEDLFVDTLPTTEKGLPKKEGAKEFAMHWLKLNQVLQLFKGMCNNMDAWLKSSYYDIIWAGQPFATILIGLDEAVQRMTVEVNAKRRGV